MLSLCSCSSNCLLAAMSTKFFRWSIHRYLFLVPPLPLFWSCIHKWNISRCRGHMPRLEKLAMIDNADLPDKRRHPASYPLSTMDLRSGDELSRSSSALNQHTSRENLESCLENCCKNDRFSNFLMFTELVKSQMKRIVARHDGTYITSIR